MNKGCLLGNLSMKNMEFANQLHGHAVSTQLKANEMMALN